MRNPIARQFFDGALDAHRHALAQGRDARTGNLRLAAYKALFGRHDGDVIWRHLDAIVGIVDGLDALARECAHEETP